MENTICLLKALDHIREAIKVAKRMKRNDCVIKLRDLENEVQAQLIVFMSDLLWPKEDA